LVAQQRLKGDVDGKAPRWFSDPKEAWKAGCQTTGNVASQARRSKRFSDRKEACKAGRQTTGNVASEARRSKRG